MISDVHGRSFKTLRLSLTSVCNFTCNYCVPEGYQNTPVKDTDTGKILAKVALVHQELNLQNVRLTGGEPLLYQNLCEVIRALKAIGIPKVKMTSNAFLLKNKAAELKAVGLDEINISLDAIDPEVFYQMTGRRAINKVVEGIDAALKAGIEIKLNAVIKRSENESQILTLMAFARERNVTLRFLELMSMGHIFDVKSESVFTESEILDVIRGQFNFQKLPRAESATSNYWQTEEGQLFGIIANESSPFCGDCNRLRMDHYGKVYGCLSSNNGIQLEETDKSEDLRIKLKKALDQKQQVRFSGSTLSMIDIGG